PVRVFRLAGFDLLQSELPRARVGDPVVIVQIDEASLAALGQWPWPRVVLARLVSTIADRDPAAIGLDILMPEPDRLSPGRVAPLLARMDQYLAERLQQLPSNDAVLAAALQGRPVVVVLAGLDQAEPPATSPGLRAVPVPAFGGDPGRSARRFVAALRSVDEVDAAAPGHELVDLELDGGVVRRVALAAAVGPTLMPSLGLEMLRLAAGEPELTVHMARAGIRSVGVGKLAIPTQPDGT